MRTVRCSSCLLGGGVSAQGSAGAGVLSARGVSAQRGCLPRGLLGVGVVCPGDCLPREGVCPGGWGFLPRGGVCLGCVSTWGCLPRGEGGVWLGGVSTWEWSAQGCVSALGVYPSMHWGRHPPPVNRMTYRCTNITLPQLCCGR